METIIIIIIILRLRLTEIKGLHVDDVYLVLVSCSLIR